MAAREKTGIYNIWLRLRCGLGFRGVLDSALNGNEFGSIAWLDVDNSACNYTKIF